MGTHVFRRGIRQSAAWLLIWGLFVSSAVSSAWAQPVPPATAPVQPVPGPALGPAAPAVAPSAGAPLSTAERERQAALQAERMLAAPSASATGSAATAASEPTKQIDLWALAIGGGVLMIPIAIGSVIVVCFAFERAFGLRRRKLLPPGLVTELGDLARRPGGLDPRAVYRACLRHPSSAANILRAVLLKVGRPHAELEQTLKDVNEREAARLYKHVRPIELQVSVAPLLGLLGTVQGMIMAFFKMASGTTANRTEDLAEGIYIALVTTFAGLCVAIPAAALAHYFEGKIQAFFGDSDELIHGLLPSFERYEGKVRVNRQTLAGEEHAEAPSAAPAVERAPLAAPK
jgi:biopolymer transport protein ExbB